MSFILAILAGLLELISPPYEVPQHVETAAEIDAAVYRRMELRETRGVIIRTPPVSADAHKR